jgi:hypothetical protein
MSFRDGGAGGALSRRVRGTGPFRSCVHGWFTERFFVRPRRTQNDKTRPS